MNPVSFMAAMMIGAAVSWTLFVAFVVVASRRGNTVPIGGANV